MDFLLTGAGRPDAYVEVKNVHLRRDGDWAEFPDSVTARGARHLRELAAVAAAGQRAVMLYVVQRTDCGRLRLAADLDPAYAAASAAARGGRRRGAGARHADRPERGLARPGAAGGAVRVAAGFAKRGGRATCGK